MGCGAHVVGDRIAGVVVATPQGRGVLPDDHDYSYLSMRSSAFRDADLIVVLREGRIAESGTHAELLGRGGFYTELHRRQLLEEEMSTGEDAA